jgi:hypothetical protein
MRFPHRHKCSRINELRIGGTIVRAAEKPLRRGIQINNRGIFLVREHRNHFTFACFTILSQGISEFKHIAI